MLGDQLVQRGDPGQPLRQPTARQHPARFVLDLDVMMGLGPVVTDEQHRASRSRMINKARAAEKTCYDLMDQCSTGTTSHQHYRPPHQPPGHDLVIDLKQGQARAVLTGRPARTTECLNEGTVAVPMRRR